MKISPLTEYISRPSGAHFGDQPSRSLKCRGDPAGNGYAQKDASGNPLPCSSNSDLSPEIPMICASEITAGTPSGAASPPVTESCTRLLSGPELSSKYNRFPSLTIPNFCRPSCVSCRVATIFGTASTGRNRYAATKTPMRTIAAAGTSILREDLDSSAAVTARLTPDFPDSV